MKVITFTNVEGRTSVCRPVPWARLVSRVGDYQIDPPLPLDIANRRAFSPDDMTRLDVDWAETEDEFVQRIRSKDVPADATNVQIIDDADIPAR